MRNYMFIAVLLTAICWSFASNPVESVDRYNIVLVHGAADRWQGLDCDNGEPNRDGKIWARTVYDQMISNDGANWEKYEWEEYRAAEISVYRMESSTSFFGDDVHVPVRCIKK